MADYSRSTPISGRSPARYEKSLVGYRLTGDQIGDSGDRGQRLINLRNSGGRQETENGYSKPHMR